MLYKTKVSKWGVYLCNIDNPLTKEQMNVIIQTQNPGKKIVILNGVMFNRTTGVPSYNLKLNDQVLATDAYPALTYIGYTWNNGDLVPELIRWPTPKQNFITTGVALVKDSLPVIDAYYKNDILGTRGRTAFGYTNTGELIIWCSSDVYEPKSMIQLRELMANAGCVTSINLDGGGSSQAITPNWIVNSSDPLRAIYNYLWFVVDDLLKYYKVQIGAFKNKLYASTFAKKLELAGFETYIPPIGSDGIYRVQCGAFPLKESAEALKIKLLNAGFVGAFVIYI